jgi:hypothetical protein
LDTWLGGFRWCSGARHGPRLIFRGVMYAVNVSPRRCLSWTDQFLPSTCGILQASMVDGAFTRKFSWNYYFLEAPGVGRDMAMLLSLVHSLCVVVVMCVIMPVFELTLMWNCAMAAVCIEL